MFSLYSVCSTAQKIHELEKNFSHANLKTETKLSIWIHLDFSLITWTQKNQLRLVGISKRDEYVEVVGCWITG